MKKVKQPPEPMTCEEHGPVTTKYQVVEGVIAHRCNKCLKQERRRRGG